MPSAVVVMFSAFMASISREAVVYVDISPADKTIRNPERVNDWCVNLRIKKNYAECVLQLCVISGTISRRTN